MNPLAIRIAADLKAFKANMAEMKAQLETNASAMKRMSNSLDGSKVIADANAMVAGIRNIGGASKLTEAEQRRVNATVTEALAKYRALGREAPPELLALRDATAKVNQETAKTPSMMEQVKTKSIALGVAAGMFLGGVALSAVNKLGSEIGEFAQRGIQLRAVEESFVRLSAGSRQSATEMLSSMQKASRGLVSEFDLMKSANKAMLLGLPVTAQEMGTLTAAATTLGRAMGLDARQSVDDLITALGRSSPMILDNLGLTVKVGEANEIYAKQLGKTVEALTDAEKKTAFYNEAMRKAKEKTKELGEQSLTLSEYLSILWTNVGNKVSSGVSAVNKAGGDLIGGAGQAVSTATGLWSTMKKGVMGAVFDMSTLGRTQSQVSAIMTNAAPPVKAVAAAQASYTAQLAKARAELAALSPEVIANFRAADKLGKSDEELAKVLKLTETHVSLLKDQLRDTDKQITASASESKKFSEEVKSLGDRYANLVKEGVPAAEIVQRLGKDALDARDKAQELGKGISALPPKLVDLGRQYVIVTALQKADQEAQKLTPGIVAANVKATMDLVVARSKATDQAMSEAKRLSDAQMKSSMTTQQYMVAQAKRTLDETRRVLAPLKDVWPELWKIAMDAADQEFQRGVDAAGEAGRDAAQRFREEWDRQFEEGLQAARERTLAEFKGLLDTLDTFASVGSQIADLFEGKWSGVLSNLSNGVSAASQAVASFIKGDLVGAIQAGVSALISFGKAIGDAFGFNNPGRDMIVAFSKQFGDFDGLREQLLVLGDEGERLWIQLTQIARGEREVAAATREILEALEAYKTSPEGIAASNFQTREELQALADQWKATYDYMLASGKYTAAQLAEAWKRYEDATKAAVGEVDGRPMGARGFPTKAQLQTAAKEAEEAYRYVRDSGLYTADVIEQAWQQWQDAMIASGDETAKRMKDLTAEIAALQKAVEMETPEYDVNGVRIYGVEEQRNIERLAALEAERDRLEMERIAKETHATEEAAAQADLTAKKEFEAAKIRALDLDGYLRKLFSGGYEIPITFRLPNGAPGGQPTPPSWFGGPSGGQTPIPHRSGNSVPLLITIVNQMDSEVVARKTVRHTAELLPNELDFVIGSHR